ncbi:MAG: DNA starvation/stationary phase protection protein [Pseudomonadota bacterium]|jgi:starvation-inducible DNA-binding protein|nr:DNA starvation/stationary phase protection protein [Pseudomonadota bacterium]QKK05031.1 MAG: DNA starvation/stationary phase protection protein [Pseudomonadota bacterium]|tara:strand:+ start:479 stop:946 length:468 start_codon:yes stop_codon:yes gene_type:complete
MSNQAQLQPTPQPDVVQALSVLLADSYGLYLKTQNYHWNVTGPMFQSLHTLFQTQYEELTLIVDEIAERIRALGAKAPGSYSAFAKLGSIKEENGNPTAAEMIENLAADQNLLIATAQTLLAAAQAVGDEATADLAIGRITLHEKNRWMLLAHQE